MGIIYLSRNIVNNKCYIGKTSKTIEHRKKEHIRDAPSRKYNMPFHDAINKYGTDSFRWSKLDEANDEHTLNLLEKFYILHYKKIGESLYNLSGGGDGFGSGENHPCYGKPKSEQQRKKMSENNCRYWKGKHLPKEHREKISKAVKGVNHPLYGVKCSEERCKKISKAHEGRGLFGFTGCTYKVKNQNPWTRVWNARIRYNKYRTSLGVFEDPLSCEIVRNLIKEEL